MQNCSKCGSEILSGDLFCNKCGNPIGDTQEKDLSIIENKKLALLNCPVCKTELADSTTRCPQCGTAFKNPFFIMFNSIIKHKYLWTLLLLILSNVLFYFDFAIKSLLVSGIIALVSYSLIMLLFYYDHKIFPKLKKNAISRQLMISFVTTVFFSQLLLLFFNVITPLRYQSRANGAGINYLKTHFLQINGIHYTLIKEKIDGWPIMYICEGNPKVEVFSPINLTWTNLFNGNLWASQMTISFSGQVYEARPSYTTGYGGTPNYKFRKLESPYFNDFLFYNNYKWAVYPNDHEKINERLINTILSFPSFLFR